MIKNFFVMTLWIGAFAASANSYYINITEKILELDTLPFHTISQMLDDSVFLESSKKWARIYENNGKCLYTRCSKNTESCLEILSESDVTQDELISVSEMSDRFLSDSSDSTENTYMLLAGICEDNQYCDINKNYNGICVNYSSYVERDLLPVGHSCTDDMYWKMCGYGKRECINKQCAPIDDDDICQSSMDCAPTKYCSSSGQCVTSKQAGETCTYQEECGRTGACYFSDLRVKTGICVKYFSKYEGESVATYSGHDQLFTSNQNMTVLPQMNLLCETGYVNEEGYCAQPTRKSLYKGKMCIQDRDCKTNLAGSVAKCKCGVNPWAMKICDIAEGDDEWQDAFTKFKEYYQDTKDCGVGTKWKKCKQNKKYEAMKCAALKARFYTWYQANADIDSCTSVLFRTLPIFSEIEAACKAASAKALVLPSLLLLGVFLLAL